MKAVQLLNILALLERRLISFRCFRVYLGCFALVAIRDAARRDGRLKAGRGVLPFVRYQVREVARLCGTTQWQVRRDLTALRKANLLWFDERDIRASEALLPECAQLCSLVRSPTRPVPVPRAVLRFLAQERRQSVSKSMIAYMLRGLTISRHAAEVCGKGSVKLSWVCAVAGLSERAGRYARGELIRLGWIERDTGSRQWKLNRHGAYFSINLDWSHVTSAAPQTPTPLAPHTPAKPPVFAPLNKDRKTPYGSKNQKTHSGVFTNQSMAASRRSGPTLRDVKKEDLSHLSRCEALYWQAVGEGIISPSESSALNFLAAAVRARSIKAGDPARVFVSIIRRSLWSHITNEQEEVARKALSRIREVNPHRFRLPEARIQPPQSPSLEAHSESTEAELIAEQKGRGRAV